MGYDRKYLVWALFYVAAGMVLGIYMAGSHNHAQQVTHANPSSPHLPSLFSSLRY